MLNERRLEQIRKDSKFTQDENGNMFVQLKVSDYTWLVSESLRAEQLQQEIARLTKERDQYFEDRNIWIEVSKIQNQQLQQSQAKLTQLKELGNPIYWGCVEFETFDEIMEALEDGKGE